MILLLSSFNNNNTFRFLFFNTRCINTHSNVGAHERNSSDSRMVTHKVDSIVLPVYHINHAIRAPRVLQQPHQQHGAARHPLGRLEHVCVAAYRRHREHLGDK